MNIIILECLWIYIIAYKIILACLRFSIYRQRRLGFWSTVFYYVTCYNSIVVYYNIIIIIVIHCVIQSTRSYNIFYHSKKKRYYLVTVFTVTVVVIYYICTLLQLLRNNDNNNNQRYNTRLWGPKRRFILISSGEEDIIYPRKSRCGALPNSGSLGGAKDNKRIEIYIIFYNNKFRTFAHTLYIYSRGLLGGLTIVLYRIRRLRQLQLPYYCADFFFHRGNYCWA